MQKWLKWAIEIQSLAQAGLSYTNNVYDIERYERLREISAEMLEEQSNLSMEKVKELFCNETGYQTPKIDTRAVIFYNGKILLTHENNVTWSLPGGWCDVLESFKSNTIKEVKEETGLDVEMLKIISIQDRNKYKESNEVIGIISGKKKDDETIELGYSISSKYFNKGITTEALGSIIDYLFNELGYLTVEAIIPSLNVGSIKVTEKCLMKRKLILNGKYKDKDGNIQDLIVYSRSKR